MYNELCKQSHRSAGSTMVYGCWWSCGHALRGPCWLFVVCVMRNACLALELARVSSSSGCTLSRSKVVVCRDRLQSGLCCSIQASNAFVHDKAHAHSTHQTMMVPALLEGFPTRSSMCLDVLSFAVSRVCDCCICAGDPRALWPVHQQCALSLTGVVQNSRVMEQCRIKTYRQQHARRHFCLLHSICPMHWHNDCTGFAFGLLP